MRGGGKPNLDTVGGSVIRYHVEIAIRKGEPMAIIDLDSHLRDGWIMDEIYQLQEPFVEYTPKRIGDGKYYQSKFEHRLGPDVDKKAVAAFKEPVSHTVFYNPKLKCRSGEIAKWQRGGYDMEYRLKDNAREGTDLQFIFPTGIDIPAQTPGPLGIAVCKAYNSWVHGLVSGHEDRLFPVAMTNARSPEEMATELRRCVKELRFRACHLVSYTPEHTIDDPVFDPFYEAAQELDVPLFCHPGTFGDHGTLINRFSHFMPIHVLGRPLNSVAALMAVVLGGVFERFPKLKVVFFECTAEFLVFWMHRMDDDYEILKDEGFVPKLTMFPSEYVRRNCYITCEADEKMLPMALHEIGEDHVLMATDYPHFDSTFPETVKTIRERPDLTKRQKQMILEENALQLVNV